MKTDPFVHFKKIKLITFWDKMNNLSPIHPGPTELANFNK